ncbi:HNH endonuclease [Vibrio phage 184E37-3b]|nr:hypothetical protein MYOV056v2_p0032 [Vibrio phage 184E37.3a]QZI90023.1 putative NUMOD1 domain [Vibrio phage 184E37.1]
MKCEYIRDTDYLIYEDGTVISPKGRTISPWKENNTGYYLFRVRRNKKPLCLRLHRILAESFLDNPKGYTYVCHLNDIKDDNRLENLAWGMPPKNAQEGYDNGCYAYPTRRFYGVKVVCHMTEKVFIFKSIRSCADSLKLNRKNISAVLKGKKTNTYPFDFEYFEMPND